MRGGKWRIRLGYRSPITGDCLLVVLAWVGNSYFGHEAIRRGLDTPPFERFSGKVLPNGNVLCGLLTEKAIGQYVAQSLVRLDAEQRRVLADMNTAGDPLLCMSALAGTGKTALAHCVLKAFMEGHRSSTPRQLVLYTSHEDLAGGGGAGAPQVQGGACLGFFDVCASCADVRSCQMFVAFQTLPIW